MAMQSLAFLAGLSVSIAAFGASRQPPAAAVAADDSDALRGPSVAKSTNRPERSIVERDFNGRLKKLDDIPALAALARLQLTPETKARVDRVLGERAAAIDTIVRDNLKLILELGGAEQAKDIAAAAKARAELFQKAQPFLKRGPILGEIKGALPDDSYAELKRMVDEYTAIAVQDRMDDPMDPSNKAAGGKPNRFGAFVAQGFETFGQEVKASFQRVVEAGGKDFEELIRMLALTPEQESKVRQKATDLYLKTYGKPTKGQQLRLFLDIYGELDTEQRHRLAQRIGEENRARRSAQTPTKPADPMQKDDAGPMMGKP